RPLSLILLYLLACHRDLHSFPTRRSSDLCVFKCKCRLAGNRISLNSVEHQFSPLSVLFHIFVTRIDEIFLLIKIKLDSLFFIVEDRKSTRLNSSHVKISYAVFCLKKKKKQ